MGPHARVFPGPTLGLALGSASVPSRKSRSELDGSIVLRNVLCRFVVSEEFSVLGNGLVRAFPNGSAVTVSEAFLVFETHFPTQKIPLTRQNGRAHFATQSIPRTR